MPNTARAQSLHSVPDGYAYNELLPLVHTTLSAGISVFLRGHPGVGKSAMAAQLAERMQLPMVDIRLAQCDPAEIAGVYFPDRDKQVLALFPPQWVREACARPSLVFLDEVNAAVTRLHQAAAYQIVLEHRVGPFAFHPQTVVLAAGNLEQDNAIVTRLSSALSNRFAHFTLRVDAKDWVSWGASEGIHESILAYISRYGEQALYNLGSDAFPSPRSWAMASALLQVGREQDAKRLVASCVGLAAAEQLDAFIRIYRRVNARQIIQEGRPMDFSRGKTAEPSFIYAALFSVAAWLRQAQGLDRSQLANVVTFLRSPGLDPEFVFLFLRQLRQSPLLYGRLKRVPAFRDLARELVDVWMALYR